MRLFRIGHLKYLDDLSGMGASFTDGGRWNAQGVPVLYFAQAASIAMLEMANYLPSTRMVPTNYRLGIFEVADDMPMDCWALKDLPGDWREFPYPRSTQRLGTHWLQQAEAPLHAVPSTVVPGGLENIVLASPSRLDISKVKLLSVEQDIYGLRIFATHKGDKGRGR